MKGLILAGGYGTRMQSIAGDLPKALIPVGENTVLDTLVANLADSNIDILLVTNDKYVTHFENWQKEQHHPVEIISDGSTTPDNRLGAIGDLEFAIRSFAVDDDLLVVAADNFISFQLSEMIWEFKQRPTMLLAVWENKDRKDQSNRGVLEMNEDSRITSFVEKPKEPRSSFAAAPIYLFPRSLVNVPGRYLAQGHNHDAPGFLMEYIVSRYEVRGWRMPGDVIDVGNPESYLRAVRLAGKRKLFSKNLNESQDPD